MEYFILKPDGEQTGTFSLDQIRSMLNSGYIGLDTRYWHEGISDWQPVDRIEESLNFPEPSPNEPHAAPPPRSKLSGSLARAIPSPHQQKQRASSVTSSKTPALIPSVPVIPEPVKTADIPGPSSHVEHANGSSAPAQPPVAPAPRRPLITWAQVRTLATLLLALAIIAAVVASRHPAKSPLSRVTLTNSNDYVLVDQASIKTFEDDMRNSPVAVALQRQIAHTTDTALLARITISLQQETARHTVEITQQYLRSGKAKVVEPGTYSTVAFFDDNGVLTPPRAGAPWVAVLDHGNIVYTYQGTDLNLASH